MIIIVFISSIIGIAIPENKNMIQLNKEMETISSKMIKREMKVEEYLNQIASLTYQIEKENFIPSLVSVVIAISYYVIFQFYNHGQTIGKKLLKIKVMKKDGELSINDMIFRSFIIQSLAYNLILFVLLFTTKDTSYLYTTYLLSVIQFCFMIAAALMVVIRKDKLALHDILTKTQVVVVDPVIEAVEIETNEETEIVEKIAKKNDNLKKTYKRGEQK